MYVTLKSGISRLLTQSVSQRRRLIIVTVNITHCRRRRRRRRGVGSDADLRQEHGAADRQTRAATSRQPGC